MRFLSKAELTTPATQLSLLFFLMQCLDKDLFPVEKVLYHIPEKVVPSFSLQEITSFKVSFACSCFELSTDYRLPFLPSLLFPDTLENLLILVLQDEKHPSITVFFAKIQ